MIGDERVLMDTKKETKKMDLTQAQMSFAVQNCNSMKNGWKESMKQFIVSVILQQFLFYFTLRISQLFLYHFLNKKFNTRSRPWHKWHNG